MWLSIAADEMVQAAEAKPELQELDLLNLRDDDEALRIPASPVDEGKDDTMENLPFDLYRIPSSATQASVLGRGKPKKALGVNALQRIKQNQSRDLPDLERSRSQNSTRSARRMVTQDSRISNISDASGISNLSRSSRRRKPPLDTRHRRHKDDGDNSSVASSQMSEVSEAEEDHLGDKIHQEDEAAEDLSRRTHKDKKAEPQQESAEHYLLRHSQKHLWLQQQHTVTISPAVPPPEAKIAKPEAKPAATDASIARAKPAAPDASRAAAKPAAKDAARAEAKHMAKKKKDAAWIAEAKPAFVQQRSVSAASLGSEAKTCVKCGESYNGFGDTCPTCRKGGRRATIIQCTLCHAFLLGFDKVCDECKASAGGQHFIA